MKNYSKPDILITGMGVTSAVGQGKDAFKEALMEGRHAFGIMKRPGRQKQSSFIGAEIPDLLYPEQISKRLIRTASFSAHAAAVTICEAWEEAKLHQVDPERIGLVIGGSNFQQRELIETYTAYKDREQHIRPTYGLSFMDSDVCGVCTEQFGIKGFAYTLGGASASGQMAILQAIQAVQCGQVDICIAVGALMDLSYWECQAFRALGAMGSDRYADAPTMACRPFDKNRDGFIYGEACGAVVIERSDSALRRQVTPYAVVAGWAVGMDGNRNPNPSYEGEVRVIKNALAQAGVLPRQIDYINPHGTGSLVGDETELKVLKDCGLSHAYLNATKSIIGHGLSAAGAVEFIATLLQMEASQLHPARNLEEPMDSSFNWVKGQAVVHPVKYALKLSMGFGGVNTCICMEKYETNT
ncbi:MAG: polyketide beta-ketoacyl:ACP synthase [Clostridia bacterium]|nr:polyketide beta-ketoacyl:ACP synthase [Clostridia bacterium]